MVKREMDAQFGESAAFAADRLTTPVNCGDNQLTALSP
jgi:hypothetical protein